MTKRELCIVGTGKVAQALIKNLSSNYRILVTSPSEDRAIELSKVYHVEFLPYGKNTTCKRFIIVRKDKDIKQTSLALTTFYPNSIHIHMSGLLSAEILSSNQKCSMHPIMSITPNTSLKGIMFAVDGNKEVCEDIITNLNSKYFIIDSHDKPLYHTALVFLSNFTALNTLLGKMLLNQIGNLPPEITKHIKNLACKSIDNVLTYGSEGLTGPAARGDTQTIQKEKDLLNPILSKLYDLQSEIIYILKTSGGIEDEKDDST